MMALVAAMTVMVSPTQAQQRIIRFPSGTRGETRVRHDDRIRALTRNDVAFTRFLTAALIPSLDGEFRTVSYRTLTGHSRGGRFASLAPCHAPAMFTSVVSRVLTAAATRDSPMSI